MTNALLMYYNLDTKYRKEIKKMADFIKAIYQAIVDAFSSVLPGDGEKRDLFTSIKEAFDDFFSGLK